MLQITIPAQEKYDPIKREFIDFKETELQLEHSLVSISKWEAKWNKAFLGKDPKTEEESIDYIRCMTITQKVPDIAYKMLTADNVRDINNYISAPMMPTTTTSSMQKAIPSTAPELRHMASMVLTGFSLKHTTSIPSLVSLRVTSRPKSTPS